MVAIATACFKSGPSAIEGQCWAPHTYLTDDVVVVVKDDDDGL